MFYYVFRVHYIYHDNSTLFMVSGENINSIADANKTIMNQNYGVIEYAEYVGKVEESNIY